MNLLFIFFKNCLILKRCHTKAAPTKQYLTKLNNSQVKLKTFHYQERLLKEEREEEREQDPRNPAERFLESQVERFPEKVLAKYQERPPNPEKQRDPRNQILNNSNLPKVLSIWDYK